MKKQFKMLEAKKNKKSKYPKSETTPYNPWAVCTDSVGREDKEKYERCVKHVKEDNRERNKKDKKSMNSIDKKVEAAIQQKKANMETFTLSNRAFKNLAALKQQVADDVLRPLEEAQEALEMDPRSGLANTQEGQEMIDLTRAIKVIKNFLAL